jgi:tetratricopeptide (TPR) repeat protein
MPTINKRFLLKLVLVAAVLTGALFGVHAVQAHRIPDALRRQADRAADAGKPDAAAHYLRQYLEFAPDDVEAQVLLLEQLRKRKPHTRRSQADLVFLYDRILRLDPDRHPVRRDALAACLDAGRYPDAATHAGVLLKAFPAEAGLWQQLGAAQAGLNQLAEARKSYETAVGHDPDGLLGYQRLAQLVWQNLRDTAGARAVLDRMVKALPQNPDALLTRARFEAFPPDDAAGPAGRGDPAKAVADLQRVLELDPENAEASILLAELLQRDRKVPAAHAVLRDAAALYPKNLKIVRSLSWLELIRGNAPAAIAVLEDGLKATPDGFDLLVPLADLLVQQGDTARTTDILKRLEARKAPPAQVKYLRARLAMRDAKWADANAQLEALLSETTNLPGLETQLNLLLAVTAGKLADPAGEEKAFRRVLATDPKNAQARVGLGTLYLNLGRFDDAVRELEAAAQSPFAPAGVVAQWVRTKAARLRTANALPDEWRRLEQALAGFATPAPAATAGRGPWTYTPSAASRFGPASSEPVILMAELWAGQGRHADAVRLLRREATRRPGDVRLWAALAETTADATGTPAGLAVLDEAQAAAGDNPDVRLARARLYVAEPGRVRPLYSLAERIESWPEAEQARLLFGLVEVFDAAGDRRGVAHVFRALASLRPSDVHVWVKVHEWPATKPTDEALAALLKIEGEDGPSVLLCRAASATPDTAPHWIAKFAGVFTPNPTRADACLALARLSGLVGNDAESTRLTERAFTLDPTRYDAARAWLVRLCTAGPDDRARELVNRLGTDPRWAGDSFRRLVGSVVPKVQVPVAAKLLTWSRPHVERDPNGLGWLGETAAAHKVFDPVPVLEEAARRKGATADDWLRLALVRTPADLNGCRGAVLPAAYLAAAAVLNETPAGKDFVPDLQDAAWRRSFAQARLAVKLSRGASAEATKVLEDYLAGGEVAKADAAWASRNLAMLCAAGGTPADRKRATELLAGLGDTDTTADQHRSTAGVLTTLARYLEGGERRAVLARAAAALDAAYKVGKSPKDLFDLSQLYRAAGERAEARKCLQTLIDGDPKNIDYLTTAVEELVEDGNFAAAGAFAKKLLAEHRGEFRAVAAAARCEAKAGHPEAALALAEGYARSADPAAGNHLARAGRVAELLDELSRLPGVRGTPAGRAMTDAAVDRYASLVPIRAEAVVGVAGALAADGRAAEAFARVDALDRHVPARVKAAAGLAVVRNGEVTERQAAAVREWLDACLAEGQRSAAVRMNRAEFLALRRDVAGAAAEFEAVVASDPRNVVALNNLAWLLAADPATAGRALELVARATREVGLTGDLLDTRARVRLTLKQFDDAERDLTDAIRLEPTGLRWFHLALAHQGRTPARAAEARDAFREALRRGLTPRGVHPADRAAFDALAAAAKSGG